MTRVAVLKGGRSLERSVSLASGARVEAALQRLDFEVLAIDVGPDLVSRLRDGAPDVAFIALHGRGGEDGTVQELLEMLGIPYTGSPIHACVRCANKTLTKHALRDAGLPTPDWISLGEIAFSELGAAEALPEIESRLGFPLVVKPASQGSSLGVMFARTAVDIPAALIAASSYGRTVLLEQAVTGRELAVSILAGGGSPSPPQVLPSPPQVLPSPPQVLPSPPQVLPSPPQVLPIVEAVPRGREFYDFAARYDIGRTDFVCPPELPAGVAERVREIALAAWELLGCRGFARVDMLLADDGPTVLEVNAIPGLTDTSLLPQAADAAGLSFEDVVARVLDEAINR